MDAYDADVSSEDSDADYRANPYNSPPKMTPNEHSCNDSETWEVLSPTMPIVFFDWHNENEPDNSISIEPLNNTSIEVTAKSTCPSEIYSVTFKDNVIPPLIEFSDP